MLAVVLAFVADCYPGRRADSCAAALANCLFPALFPDFQS